VRNLLTVIFGLLGWFGVISLVAYFHRPLIEMRDSLKDIQESLKAIEKLLAEK